MDHPPFDTLLDYLAGALAAETRAAVERHLETPCARCAATLARLRAALEALENDDTAAPPPAVLRQAVEAFRDRSWSAVPPPQRVRAVLVFDNYRQGPLMSARGGAAQARQMLFRAEALDIDLRITFAEGGAIVEGQILGGERPPSAVRVGQQGEILDAVTVDSYGQFAFRPLPPGQYDLEIELGAQEISIEALDLADAAQ